VKLFGRRRLLLARDRQFVSADLHRLLEGTRWMSLARSRSAVEMITLTRLMTTARWPSPRCRADPGSPRPVLARVQVFDHLLRPSPGNTRPLSRISPAGASNSSTSSPLQQPEVVNHAHSGLAVATSRFRNESPGAGCNAACQTPPGTARKARCEISRRATAPARCPARCHQGQRPHRVAPTSEPSIMPGHVLAGPVSTSVGRLNEPTNHPQDSNPKFSPR